MRNFWGVTTTLLLVVVIFLQVYTITHFAEVKAMVASRAPQVAVEK